MENKLKESERLNKEYQLEIKAMQRIQMQQSKALEQITNENDFSGKVQTLQNELRIVKEQNRQFRQKLYDTEKNNQRMHQTMMSLEETVRELRAAASGRQIRQVQDKQQEIVSK